MPRGKPARKRPAASASAERQPAQSSKRRHTGRLTANPVPAVEDNINAMSNSAPATNEATDAVCTPRLDSASVNGPGSSIQGSTAGIFQVTDPHHHTEARFLLQDQLNRTIDLADDEHLQLFTDSAGNLDLGCGAFFRNHWLFFKSPTEWAGVHNEVADALSRCQFQRFRTLVPQADLEPTPIPDSFLTIISRLSFKD
nr:uncharacterized protein LOC117693101 [Crassostrea gigas]